MKENIRTKFTPKDALLDINANATRREPGLIPARPRTIV